TAGVSTARVVSHRRSPTPTPNARQKPPCRAGRPPFRRLPVAKVGRADNEPGDVLLDGRAFLSCARRRLICRRSGNSYGRTRRRKKRLKRLGLSAARVCGDPRLLSKC